jgi:hypothetical protein
MIASKLGQGTKVKVKSENRGSHFEDFEDFDPDASIWRSFVSSGGFSSDFEDPEIIIFGLQASIVSNLPGFVVQVLLRPL